MDPGDILRRTWELYRAHPRHLVAIAAVVFVPLGVVSALLALLGWPGIVLANVLNLAAIFLVQGALVKAVEDVRDGRQDLGIAETYGHAGQRLLPLAGAGILATIGIVLGLLLLIVPGPRAADLVARRVAGGDARAPPRARRASAAAGPSCAAPPGRSSAWWC